MEAPPTPAPCPVTEAVGLIGGKWKVPILWHLSMRRHHFGALRRAVAGVSERVLATQLQALESDGLVCRTVHERADGGVPRRVDYSLTERGEALVPALNALADWAYQHPAPLPSRTAPH